MSRTPLQGNHVMIDLETMGVRPNACIVSLGAAHFDADNILSSFYTPVNLQSCKDLGLVVDESTEKFWSEQDVDVKAAWDVPDAPSLEMALVSFGNWLRDIGSYASIRPWGNGADFDLVLMKSAYTALQADPPWPYWSHHCFRTMKNMFQSNVPEREGPHHHAMWDAIHQVRHLQQILKDFSINLK